MEIHKRNADKAPYCKQIYRNCIKIHQNDKVQKDVINASKFRMEPKIITLLPICFKITTIYSVYCCSLPIGRRSPLEKDPLI